MRERKQAQGQTRGRDTQERKTEGRWTDEVVTQE